MKIPLLSDWLAPPLEPVSQHAFADQESEMSDELKELRGKFEGKNDLDKVVANFKGLYEWQLNRARHAEARAATIQAAVSIAASLIFAGASLALDTGKLHEEVLRGALAALAALAILAFVAAALRAMQAHMTVQPWTHPDIHNRLGDEVSALTDAQQAGEYWSVILQNERIVLWKLGRLKQAKGHFRNAILILGVLAVAVLVAVVSDSSPEKTPTQVEIVGKR